jgi:N-dimethylarginine dimethylaminohydrolase
VIPFGLKSEYAPLTGVLLYPPGPEVGGHPDPARIQQLRPIDHGVMTREYAALMAAFTGHGIRVETIDPTPLGTDRDYCYNMMYCRDLFFMTPRGAIMAAMANPTRAGEVPYAARTLERLGVPILHTVGRDGRFEGADALWLREDLVIVGVGNRTNREGFDQLAPLLADQGVTAVPLPSTQVQTQHLLGSLQLVDRDLALVREGIIDPAVTRFLQGEGLTVVPVPENSEVRERQALNIVTIAPRTIFMTNRCPETKRLYLRAGLTVAAELEISQLINGAGGLACATGTISRKIFQ